MRCDVHHQCTECTIHAPYIGEGAASNIAKTLTVSRISAPCAPFLLFNTCARVRVRAKRALNNFLSLTFYREKGSQGSFIYKSNRNLLTICHAPFGLKGAAMVHNGASSGEGRGV
jgi:hypothetical protein